MGRIVLISFDAREAGELAASLNGSTGVAADLRATLLESLSTGWLGGGAHHAPPSPDTGKTRRG